MHLTIKQMDANGRTVVVATVTDGIKAARDRRDAIAWKTKKLAWIEDSQGQLIGFEKGYP